MGITRIYYAHDVVWQGDGQPPARGVQAIVQPHGDVGAEIVTGNDYYVLDDTGRWRAVDIFGLFDFLIESGLVLFGRTIDGDDYSMVVKEAREDMGKLGWLPRERKT